MKIQPIVGHMIQGIGDKMIDIIGVLLGSLIVIVFVILCGIWSGKWLQ